MITAESLAGLTEDELYEELGGLLLGVGPGMGASGGDRLRDFGQQRFDNLKVGLAAALCNVDGTPRLPGNDIEQIATAYLALEVARDAIQGDTQKALLLAAIVTKIGLTRFCLPFAIAQQPPSE
ncbi:MAG: hypothetical protein WA892_13285 [Ornithinimicrobium sp.]